MAKQEEKAQQDQGNQSPIEKFLAKVSEGVDELVTLRIQTLIGPLKYQANKADFDTAQTDVQGIVSEIKLVTGDITTKMTENFMEGDNPLRDYHMVKESQGQEIIRKNVELLKTIASTLRKIVKDEDEDNG